MSHRWKWLPRSSSPISTRSMRTISGCNCFPSSGVCSDTFWSSLWNNMSTPKRSPQISWFRVTLVFCGFFSKSFSESLEKAVIVVDTNFVIFFTSSSLIAWTVLAAGSAGRQQVSLKRYRCERDLHLFRKDWNAQKPTLVETGQIT